MYGIAETIWNVWLVQIIDVLERYTRYLGERDFRIGE